MTETIEARLRTAMEGVTPGPWKHYNAPLRKGMVTINEVQCRGKTPIVAWSGFDDCDRPKKYHKANARYIALCSPDNICALLDENEALREKLATAERALDKIEQCARSNFGRQTEKLADIAPMARDAMKEIKA